MLNVLIIGCGAIAGGYDARHGGRESILTHAAAYRHDGRFRLAACVDPDDGRRLAFRETWAVERDYPSLAAALAEEERYDAVSICSPTGQHAADVEVLLSVRPRVIFCEKPLAYSLTDAQRIVATCRDAGIALCVNHTRRWDPAMDAMRRELQAGVWGALRSVVGIYNKGIVNNGSHMIDLLHWLLGPLRLLATARAVADYSEADPSIPALLETDAGIPVHLTTAHASDYACFELQLITEKGCITLEDGGLAWRRRQVVESSRFPGYRMLDAGVRETGGYGQAMARAVANLHDFLSTGTPLVSSGDSALTAQTMCDRILEHARRNSNKIKD